MTTGTISKPPGTAFAKSEVQAKLTELLLDAAQSDAALKGVTLPTDIATAAAHVDSLDVVSLLCEIEPIVNFELKDSIVRAGGYSSVNQAVEHLMPRIEKAWQKHGSKK